VTGFSCRFAGLERLEHRFCRDRAREAFISSPGVSAPQSSFLDLYYFLIDLVLILVIDPSVIL
jgi:hypothetical protein